MSWGNCGTADSKEPWTASSSACEGTISRSLVGVQTDWLPAGSVAAMYVGAYAALNIAIDECGQLGFG